MAIIRGTYVTRLSGAVGDVVYRMRNGQNIASQKASTVKNPRTDAQQNQRMNMATVSAAYSALKVICDHSFEGKSYGSECMGEFMKRNLSIVKSLYFSLNGKGNPYIVPNAYLVSKGSLPTVNIITLVSADDTVNMGITNERTASASLITVEQLHQFLGAEIGDQITLLGVARDVNGEQISWDGIGRQYQYRVSYARLVFDKEKASSSVNNEGAFNTENLILEKSENYQNVSFKDSAADNATIEAVLSMPGCTTDDSRTAGTIILSRKSGTDWLRSTQTLTVLNSSEQNEWNREEMLPTYSPTGEKYLNNANL